MDLFNVFRVLVGIPRHKIEYSEESRADEEDDSKKHSDYNARAPFFDFNQSSMMEDAFEVLIDNFQKQMEDNIQHFEKSFNTFAAEQPPEFDNEQDKRSLRSQMLKPGTSDEVFTRRDTDLDSAVEQGKFKFGLPVREDGMHFSVRSSMSVSTSTDGTSMTTETGNDREGCRREKITREFNGKKYIVEKRTCPGVPENISEIFVNMSQDELPDFLKNWKYK